MSSDPRYVVLTKEQYDALAPVTKQNIGAPQPFVVVGPATLEATEHIDPALHMAVELAGCFLSTINSGQLDAVQILEALYHVNAYLEPLAELILGEIIKGQTGTGMSLLMGTHSTLVDEWFEKNNDRMKKVMSEAKRRAFETAQREDPSTN